MRINLERVSTVVLTIAGVVIAASIAYRSFGPAEARASAGNETMDSIPQWRDVAAFGTRVGSATAPVTIVEFADLECPACRGFQPTLSNVLRTFKDSVSVVYVSFPLSMHRFAMPAARAQECAERAGAFERWRAAVFEKQDSLGLKSWGSYANDAGIADTASISACANAAGTPARVASALAFGRKIHLMGTPTVLVNGWRFATPPSEQEFDDAVSKALRGRRPAIAAAPGSR